MNKKLDRLFRDYQAGKISSEVYERAKHERSGRLDTSPDRPLEPPQPRMNARETVAGEEEEAIFEAEKIEGPEVGRPVMLNAILLPENSSSTAFYETRAMPYGPTERERMLGALAHFSVFPIVLLIPFAGLLIIAFFLFFNRDKSPFVQQNQNAVKNWLFSVVLYGLAAFLLTYINTCFFLLIIIFLMMTFFYTLIGTCLALVGICWRYPLSIRFLK